MARLSLAQRVSGSSDPLGPRNPTKELTPLAQRLLLALNHLAEEHDELTVVVKGFERYMRRTGVSDETITDSLMTVREYIAIILSDNAQADAVSH